MIELYIYQNARYKNKKIKKIIVHIQNKAFIGKQIVFALTFSDTCFNLFSRHQANQPEVVLCRTVCKYGVLMQNTKLNSEFRSKTGSSKPNAWLQNNRILTFRHRASCILRQAFRCSPENAFYIVNQQIYFII